MKLHVKEWEALKEQFSIARTLITARADSNLSQADVAKRMNTTQSAIARLEDGANPSIKMLRRYATATGRRLEIKLSKVEYLQLSLNVTWSNV